MSTLRLKSNQLKPTLKINLRSHINNIKLKYPKSYRETSNTSNNKTLIMLPRMIPSINNNITPSMNTIKHSNKIDIIMRVDLTITEVVIEEIEVVTEVAIVEAKTTNAVAAEAAVTSTEAVAVAALDTNPERKVELR